MIRLCKPDIQKPTSDTVEKICTKELVKCHHCNLEIELTEKSIRRNNFWFHEKCFKKIPITKTINEKTKQVKKESELVIKTIQIKRSYPQILFSGGLLVSLVGTTYFLAGEIIASIVGVCGSILFITAFKNQIIQNNKHHSKLIKTGIPGFDSVLSKGIKKNSSVLISGPPGSGKTTFGLQFIYSGAKNFDEHGVYISLSQSIDEIKNDCKSFGWDIEDLINKKKILLIDLRPFKIKDETISKDDSLYRAEQIPFEHLNNFILNSIKKINAKRIVIDSISILEMQYLDKFHMRQGLQGMIQSLENFEVTSLLISEFSENSTHESFTTSGIIQLDSQLVNNKMERTIRVTKLRGVEHSDYIHRLEIDSNGLNIYKI
ncbi:MAG: circadian clock protein KaiC [Nitrosopumilus sp.]|nr:circadian clock protein KaiC [Nitrosopumilus sp.]